MADFFAQPGELLSLGGLLNRALAEDDPPWSQLTAAVAFVKASGVRRVGEALRGFAERGGAATFALGVDHRGTSVEGLRLLLASIQPHGQIWILHNEAGSTFHPKLFLFEAERRALLILGSGNLTQGGLYTNYEAGVSFLMDLETDRDRQLLEDVRATLQRWHDETSPIVRRLDQGFLADLQREGYIVPELIAPEDTEEGAGIARSPRVGLFGRLPVRRPARRGTTRVRGGARAEVPSPAGTSFVMTLRRTDVGVGQTTRGTSRRSPEVFIPLAARDADPSFWGWPDQFVEDPTKPSKYDRVGVRMRIGVQIVPVTMWVNPVKHDLRLRSEPLRSAGNIGDIIRIERAAPTLNVDYLVEVIPQGAREYDTYLQLCTEPVRNSDKLYGYF